MPRQMDSATMLIRRLDRAVDEFISPSEVRQSHPLDVVARVVGGEPVSFEEGTSGDFAPLAVGDSWGRAWDTVWMRVSGTVPAEWTSRLRENATVAIEVDLGFDENRSGFQSEGIYFGVDGTPLKGLSPRNSHLLTDAQAGEDVLVWVEAAANPAVIEMHVHGTNIHLAHLGSWETAGEDHHYKFRGARLVIRDLNVRALLADIAVLRGIAVAPQAAKRRRALILSALDRMLNVLDPHDVAASTVAARAELAEVLAAPAGSVLTIAATAHAHIDSAWLWPLRETIRKCARTFSNVLTLMESNPDFVFACSSAQQYKWMKQYYPAIFERIRERVKSGQFVPVGGMWVESDTNMPSGEALARQFVAGQGFFLEEFGILCEEVWLPDSFGFTGALPQIARSAGAQWFFSQKLSWNQTNRMPHHTFQWEGIDGTRIFTHFTPVDSYNSVLSPEELLHAESEFEDDARHSAAIIPFGYGNGGGGPNQAMLDAAHRSADIEGLPRVQFTSPADFFKSAQAESDIDPVWVGEMYLELHRGTYSAQVRTKRGNRRSEALLRLAELWAATAFVRVGLPYPAEELKGIWENVLLLQFHDILPGSSISWVHRDAERLHGEAEVALEAIIERSLRALAGEGDVSLAVNGSPYSRRGVAPYAVAPTVAATDSGSAFVEGSGAVLRNDYLELTVDADGTFVSLVDRRSGRELVSPAHPANRFELFRDIPNDWDAWDIDEHYRRTPLEFGDSTAVSVLGDRVEIRHAFGDSSILQRVRLVDGSVDLTTEVHWHEKQKMLKLGFPFALNARESSAETQFGYITRPTHENTSWEHAKFEVVAHRWMHVTDGSSAIAVVNDSTYGHDVQRLVTGDGYVTRIRQTLVRGPIYPDPSSDAGTHVFRTRLVPGASIQDAVAAAFDIDSPLVELRGAAQVSPLATIDGEGIVLNTVKLAEDGSGDVILRVYESLGRPGFARLVVPGFSLGVVDLLERGFEKADADAIDLDLRAFQVVTVRGRAASS